VQQVAQGGDIPPVASGPSTGCDGSDCHGPFGDEVPDHAPNVMCVTSALGGSSVPFPRRSTGYPDDMEPNEFVDKLLAETALDEIECASDVERILAEQVIYLRDHVRMLQQGTVLGTHDVIRQLYARLEDKDRQIESLHGEIDFLRRQLVAPG